MKRCSTCHQTYADDLSFCLSDGTPLTSVFEAAEQQTLVRPSSAGSVSSAAASGSGGVFKFAAFAAAFLLVLVLLGGAAAALIFWPRNSAPRNDQVAATPSPALPTPAVNSAARDQIKDREDELERERQKLADERKKIEDEKRRLADDDEPQTDERQAPRFNDPGTTRLTFRRGSVGTTVSGTVGRSRVYVLRALAGQNLSATVSSAGGCVTFDGGSSSLGFSTRQGDNDFRVVNKCARPSNFSLSVTVR